MNKLLQYILITLIISAVIGIISYCYFHFLAPKAITLNNYDKVNILCNAINNMGFRYKAEQKENTIIYKNFKTKKEMFKILKDMTFQYKFISMNDKDIRAQFIIPPHMLLTSKKNHDFTSSTCFKQFLNSFVKELLKKPFSKSWFVHATTIGHRIFSEEHLNLSFKTREDRDFILKELHKFQDVLMNNLSNNLL